jgi:lipoprotein-releasing system permease protein
VSSLSFSFSLARRYLWSTRSEAAIRIITLFSIFGVSVGVMTLTVVMAVMTGFQVTLREKILGADAHIVVRSLQGTIKEWQSVEDSIKKLSGVESVAPFTYQQALIRTESQATGVIVKGVSRGSALSTQLLKYLDNDSEVLERFFTGFREEGDGEAASLLPLLVGKHLAQSLSLRVNQPVSLLSSQVTSTPFGLVPRYRRFRVVGTYASGLVDYEGGIVYAPLEATQQFFRLNDSINGLEVRVRDLDKAPEIAKVIIDTVPHRQLYAQPWTETNRAFFEAMNLEKRVYFLVLSLIVVMASFSIVSSLIMIVLEKRKDIAILRTLGAPSTSIARAFQMQGAWIGVSGVFLGVIGGLLLCFGLQRYGFPIDERIFQMATLPIHIDPINIIAVAVVAFLICFLATLYPARRAASLEPSEVLRYE